MMREQSIRAQAMAASRIKDEFLATLSHEIRTPLNSILGWVTLLRNNALSESEVQRALEVIERNARSQNHLINDLLDASSIINGRLRLNAHSLMPERVIRKAIESVRPAAVAKNISLQTDLDGRAGPVLADADRLQQIAWNLLVNAIKFTPKDGQVEMKLKLGNSYVEIVISDSGIGIEPELLPFVFDRFRQGDSSTTRKFGGLGLGLAMVRHLVELHGGTVLVESEGINCGSTFTVCLPLLPEGPPTNEDQCATATSELMGWERGKELAGTRILVVEDDFDSSQLLMAILSRCRADVRAASDAIEALAILENWHPDAIISDIEMPAINGFEFVRRVRKHKELAKIPAVALTAHTRVKDRLHALASGFQMHLAKPVEPAELLAVIVSLTKRISRN